MHGKGWHTQQLLDFSQLVSNETKSHLDVRVCVGASIVTNEHAVTLTVVARSLGTRLHLQQQHTSQQKHVNKSG
jgi:hypothetical protein